MGVGVGVGPTDRQLVYVSCANPTEDPFNNPYRAYLHAALLSVAGLFPGVTQVNPSLFCLHSLPRIQSPFCRAPGSPADVAVGFGGAGSCAGCLCYPTIRAVHISRVGQRLTIMVGRSHGFQKRAHQLPLSRSHSPHNASCALSSLLHRAIAIGGYTQLGTRHHKTTLVPQTTSATCEVAPPTPSLPPYFVCRCVTCARETACGDWHSPTRISPETGGRPQMWCPRPQGHRSG